LQTAADCCDLGNVAIDVVPDEVLLEIFDFYLCEAEKEEDWETLLHVCRRWRYIVLAAPRRLELRIVCTDGTPTREMLDIWPELPIFLRWSPGFEDDSGVDNAVAALEHNDRVCEIFVEEPTCYGWERIVAAMQHPFPILTNIFLWAFGDYSETDFELPDSLLCGSATSLQSLSLLCVSFPSLPNLLLSTPNLVCLRLRDIPPAGYISSAAMIDCLSSLTKLEELKIVFQSPPPRPDQETRRPPPSPPIVLPALDTFVFEGGSEYLADIFASIYTPSLQYSKITFLNLVVSHISRISSLIGCSSTNPNFPIEGFDRAYILFNHDFIDITFSSRKRTPGRMSLVFSIQYMGIESFWQFRSLIRDEHRSSPPFTYGVGFDVRRPGDHPPLWAARMANARWLELLRHFAPVKRLYLSEGVALCLAPGLRGLAGESGVTGLTVLPALQNLFVEGFQQSGPVEEAMGGGCGRETALWSPGGCPTLGKEKSQLMRMLMTVFNNRLSITASSVRPHLLCHVVPFSLVTETFDTSYCTTFATMSRV